MAIWDSLAKERTIAGAGFNRWLVPPAALAIHLLAAWAAGPQSLPLFVASFCLIAALYGGAFATLPAYLAELFGTQFVGAIHGRLLTAWSTAGILGPRVVDYLHDVRLEAGVPSAQRYVPIFHVLAGMLVIGLLANLLVQPVAPRWCMDDQALVAEKALAHEKAVGQTSTAGAIAPSSDGRVATVLAWCAVGGPLRCGLWVTLRKSAALLP